MIKLKNILSEVWKFKGAKEPDEILDLMKASVKNHYKIPSPDRLGFILMMNKLARRNPLFPKNYSKFKKKDWIKELAKYSKYVKLYKSREIVDKVWGK